jgi:hypothetical protein
MLWGHHLASDGARCMAQTDLYCQVRGLLRSHQREETAAAVSAGSPSEFLIWCLSV